MRPPKYETLRDEHNKARDAAQERRDRDLLEEKKRSARKGSPEPDRSAIKAQAEREFQVEQHKRYLTQLSVYERREKEAFDQAKRNVESERIMKANHPLEYGRIMNDKRRDAEREDHMHRVSQAWKERADARPGRYESERDFRDAGREKTSKEWGRRQSESVRQSQNQSKPRDQEERDRADRDR